MSKIACFLILMVSCIQLYAKEPVRLHCTNQYETPLKEVTIENGTEIKTYTADANGVITADVELAQPFTINVKDHDMQLVTVNNNSETLDIVLKKHFTWKDILNPVFYIMYGGLWMILFIIFAETGLFVGFFLPGDSLLFVAGIYSEELCKALFPGAPFFLIMLLVSAAGVLGNMVGYWFGRQSGPFLFQRKDTFFFKKKHLFTAKEFYDKNGAATVILARFLPIVRTFAPIVAGIVKMDRKKFMLYNIIGCMAWVFSMMLAGHYLNKIFPGLKHRLELIVIVIVLITTLPVLYKFFVKKDKTPRPSEG